MARLLDPTLWLLVPGEWLHRLAFGPVMNDSELEGEVVVALGLAFWLALLVVAGVAWRFRAPIERRFARLAAPARARMPALAEKAAGLVARVDAWSFKDAWSVVWRAEAAHLLVYVLPPLAIAGAKLALFVMFLPFSVMGFGDRTGPLHRLDPLDRPVCWTFASWCPTPLARYRGLTDAEVAACRPQATCPREPIAYEDPAKAAFKLAWFAVAAAWATIWHRRRYPKRLAD